MKKRYAMAVCALPLLLASGARAQITWTQQGQSYDTGGQGYLPRLATDGWSGWASIFQSAPGFEYLAYQTATSKESDPDDLSWPPLSFWEINSNYVIGHAPSLALISDYYFVGGNVDDPYTGPSTALEVHQGEGDSGGTLLYTLGTATATEAVTSGSYVFPQVFNWFSSQQYDNGFNPSVAIDTAKNFDANSASATVIEVHQAGTDQSDLWYHVGLLFYNSSTPFILWGSAQHVTNQSGSYVSGYAPSVSVSQGQVVVAYQAGGGVLAYSFGTVNVTGDTISWQNPVNYGNGYNPSMSFANGLFLEAHQADNGTGPLLYLTGELNISSTGINWFDAARPYATGCSPSVALGHVLFSAPGVGEVHSAACGEAANLLFSFAYVNY